MAQRHIDKSGKCGRRIICMEKSIRPMSVKTRNCNSRGFGVTDFSDENNIRVLP